MTEEELKTKQAHDLETLRKDTRAFIDPTCGAPIAIFNGPRTLFVTLDLWREIDAMQRQDYNHGAVLQFVALLSKAHGLEAEYMRYLVTPGSAHWVCDENTVRSAAAIESVIETSQNKRVADLSKLVDRVCIADTTPGSTGWLLAFLEEKMRLMLETARKKNADYAGKSGNLDAFHNFTLVHKVKPSISVVDGFFTRMCDKFARIGTLLASGTGPQVLNESLEDTLIDLANYCLLLAAYLESQRLKEGK